MNTPETNKECKHEYIENNMIPDTCRDCGKILKDGTNEPASPDTITKIRDWEKEFDELATEFEYREGYGSVGHGNIKDFIKKTLESYGAAIREEMIKKFPKEIFDSSENDYGKGYVDGWNNYRVSLGISIISPKE